MPKKKNKRKPQKFNGARRLRKELTDGTGHFNNHWGGMKSKQTGLTYDPSYRDIGHGFRFFMQESLQACSQICYPQDEEANKALDTIGQFFSKIWNESLEDNLQGLQQMQVMYDALTEMPKGKEAYSAWTHFFVQTFICYLFTIQKMSNGLRQGWLEETAEYNAMLTVLGSLDEDLRKPVVKQLLDRGAWPSNLSYGKLLRRLDDYLSVVREGQEIRERENEKPEDRTQWVQADNPLVDATDLFLDGNNGVYVSRSALADTYYLPRRLDPEQSTVKVHVCNRIVEAMRPWLRTADSVPDDLRDAFDDAEQMQLFGVPWVWHREPELANKVFCLVEHEVRR